MKENARPSCICASYQRKVVKRPPKEWAIVIRAHLYQFPDAALGDLVRAVKERRVFAGFGAWCPRCRKGCANFALLPVQMAENVMRMGTPSTPIEAACQWLQRPVTQIRYRDVFVSEAYAKAPWPFILDQVRTVRESRKNRVAESCIWECRHLRAYTSGLRATAVHALKAIPRELLVDLLTRIRDIDATFKVDPLTEALPAAYRTPVQAKRLLMSAAWEALGVNIPAERFSPMGVGRWQELMAWARPQDWRRWIRTHLESGAPAPGKRKTRTPAYVPPKPPVAPQGTRKRFGFV